MYNEVVFGMVVKYLLKIVYFYAPQIVCVIIVIADHIKKIYGKY